LGQIQQHKAFG